MAVERNSCSGSSSSGACTIAVVEGSASGSVAESPVMAVAAVVAVQASNSVREGQCKQ